MNFYDESKIVSRALAVPALELFVSIGQSFAKFCMTSEF